MSSEKRVAANRRNALRSTGPKTSQGKRRASVNALRHGLSMRIDCSPLAVHLPALQEMLLSEGLDEIQARELAGRILDYERNMEHHRQRFILFELPVLQGLDPPVPGGKELDTLYMVESFLDNLPEGFKLPGQASLRRAARLIGSMGMSKAREAERERRNADRHLRRSANQLVKNLRRLPP